MSWVTGSGSCPRPATCSVLPPCSPLRRPDSWTRRQDARPASKEADSLLPEKQGLRSGVWGQDLNLERGTGLEPATACLEGRSSTTELPPPAPRICNQTITDSRPRRGGRTPPAGGLTSAAHPVRSSRITSPRPDGWVLRTAEQPQPSHFLRAAAAYRAPGAPDALPSLPRAAALVNDHSGFVA